MVNPTIRGANPLTRKVRGRVYSYSHSVGRAGGGDTGFTQPVDVAVAPGGATYVLNRSPEVNPSSRVSKVTLGNTWGEEESILVFGGHGTGDGQFQRTTALALDKDENVYVADEWHHRISIFDKDGNFLEKWGTSGAGKGELARPWGIKLDRDDNLWVVDSGNHRVQAFTKDGKFIDAWGREGAEEGEFQEPWGIWLDDEGDVYVSDWRNGRVQKFHPDGSYLMTFGGPGKRARRSGAPFRRGSGRGRGCVRRRLVGPPGRRLRPGRLLHHHVLWRCPAAFKMGGRASGGGPYEQHGPQDGDIPRAGMAPVFPHRRIRRKPNAGDSRPAAQPAPDI